MVHLEIVRLVNDRAVMKPIIWTLYLTGILTALWMMYRRRDKSAPDNWRHLKRGLREI